MVRANPRLLGFSTPQPPRRSKYSEEVRTLCLTGASNRKPYDSGTPQARNCPQCGGAGTVIERLAFREGRAGEWYRCCTRCRNINFPPQPGTPPKLLERIEGARGRSSASSSASSRRRRVRGASAPEMATSRRAAGRGLGSSGVLNISKPVVGPVRASSTVQLRSYVGTPDASSDLFGPLPASGTAPLGTALDKCIDRLNDEMVARAMQESLDEEGSRIRKRRHEEMELQRIAALNVAGSSKEPHTSEQQPLTARGLEGLAKKPRTLHALIKEFLELSQEMGVPVSIPNAPSQSTREEGARGHETDGDSTMDTPTPAPRKRMLNKPSPPRVRVAPARVSTSVHIPLPRSYIIRHQPTPEVIEISSGSEDEGGDAATTAQIASRQSSVISLTDTEDASLNSEDEGSPRAEIHRTVRVGTPSDVIELTDSEEIGDDANARKENTGSSGLDVSTLTRSHHGLLASRSPTCLTDLLPSDSSQSETTDLFAEDAEDDDPYISRHALHKSKPSDTNNLATHTRRSAAPQLSSPAVEDFVPFGDIYRFEIYPSLANLADGPLPVFKQATQWMLMVKIWYDDDLPPATKMITLDERRCEIILAMYHIVRRIFDHTQIYQFQIWNPVTTDWRLHALTAPIGVSVDAGYHTLLIRLPFVTALTAWPEIIGQAYGACTTIERPDRKGKARATT